MCINRTKKIGERKTSLLSMINRYMFFIMALILEGNPMIKSQFEQLAHKLFALDGLSELKEDTKKQVKAILQAGVERMDLVTRETFDVQSKVLVRAKEQLAVLEARVAELEKYKEPE